MPASDEKVAFKIIGSSFTTCSACGGNAHPSDTHHVRGGRRAGSITESFAKSDSTLDHRNGCGARFTS